MDIFIIPGFTGYPEEKTFQDLEKGLIKKGYNVQKTEWPNIPDNLTEYNFTNTIKAVSNKIKNRQSEDFIILGFSMGGIIATYLAMQYFPKKLVLVVSPLQAGSDDDLQGKYNSWMKDGYRDITSSRFGDLRIPFTFIEDAKKYNALDYINKIKCPVLFIVGENDEKIKRQASEKLFEAANEPKYWELIPGMQHKYQYQNDKLEMVNNKILDFID